MPYKTLYRIRKESNPGVKIQWKKLIMNGTIKKTPGGLTKKDIMVRRKNGVKRYVYKRRHAHGKKMFNKYLKNDKNRMTIEKKTQKLVPYYKTKPTRYSSSHYKDYY